METAIRNFQRTCGISVDGKAGPATITRIRNYVPAETQTDNNNLSLGDRELKKGMTGSDVTQLKNILIDKEYLSGESAIGITTFDQSIHNAVVAFQRAIGIDANGIVNAQTVYFLKKQDD
jgi:peptidoglycan hydrolase-like protein with peptidoglycan-binding domain